jgi:two-component system, NtrC family, response regulator
MNKPKLLIVDDDPEIGTQMKWALAKDYEVILTQDRKGAMDAFKSERPAVVMLDLGLPPRPNDPDEGMEVLAEIMSLARDTKVVVVSGQGEKENALKALASGAYDFLCKPVVVEELRFLLKRCFYLAEMEKAYRELQDAAREDVFEGMLGNSPQMDGVFAYIRKVAPTTAPVLILGESGTGKEMAALAIHRRSPRKDGQLIAINCNAIPENLLESELFGHEKGAFTGAHMQRKGLIESAADGTLFLDEIGELPAPVQVKLLRFLQERVFQRVGGRQEIHVDTRVVTATHADLKQAIAAGKFREDLYFRLAVVTIHLPALRDRGDDVMLVARQFLQRFATQNGKTGMSFAPDAIRAIRRYAWPGNVRELQNRVQRAVIMADGKRITPADLELAEAGGATTIPTLKELRESVEREAVQRALQRNMGKIAPAAAELGVSRPTVYELMEKYGLSKTGTDAS